MGYQTINFGAMSTDEINNTLVQISQNPSNKLLDVLIHMLETYPQLQYDYIEAFKTFIPLRLSDYTSDELMLFADKLNLSNEAFEGNSFLYWYVVLRKLYFEGKHDEYKKMAASFFLSTDEIVSFVIYEEMVLHAILNKEEALLEAYSAKWDQYENKEIEGSSLRDYLEVYRQASLLEALYVSNNGFTSADEVKNNELYKEKTKAWTDRERDELTNLIEAHYNVYAGRLNYKPGVDFYENYWSLLTYFMNYMKEELEIPFYQSFLMAMLNQISWNKKKFKNAWMKGVVDILEGSGFGAEGDKLSFVTYRNLVAFHGICYFYEFLYTAGQLNEREYDQIIDNLQLSRTRIYKDFIPNLWIFNSIINLVAPECFEEEEVEKERALYVQTATSPLEEQHRAMEEFLNDKVSLKGMQNSYYI